MGKEAMLAMKGRLMLEDPKHPKHTDSGFEELRARLEELDTPEAWEASHRVEELWEAEQRLEDERQRVASMLQAATDALWKLEVRP